MMRHKTLAFLLALATLTAWPAAAQFRNTGFEVGIHGGTTYDHSTGAQDIQPGITGRLSLAAPLLSFVQWEVGVNYAELRDRQVHSVLTPGDMILKISPFWRSGFIPYVFGGGGILYYRYDKFPANTAAGTDRNGWVAYVPAGAGAQFRISSRAQFEVRGAYTHLFSPDVSPGPTRKDDDSYFSVLAGIRLSAGGGNPDRDGDGLLNRDEKKYGTDSRNPDTDADSLKDGEEVHTYLTNPRNADTDSDSLRDGAEVRIYRTDPLKVDTDGDGLGDGAEIIRYDTNPLKSDTDDDGLADGREITSTQTDPKKPDTDGDGLSDGDEVVKYKTDPKKMDTDGGTIADGLEIERKSDPLDPADDVKKEAPQVLVFEMNKPVVLPGIQFEFNKAVIKPESEAILIQAYNSLNEHSEIEVEIGGHTDAIGSDAYNQKLSERRAEAVRQWLINKGITATRLRAVGYGETRPVASNDTEEGRALNRRIEFTRVK